MSRRRLLWLGGAGVAGLIGLRLGLPHLLRPARLRALDPELEAFVDRCWEGIDRSRAWDTHVHLIGLGAGDTGCWINPEMQSHLHPIQRLQYDVYVSSIGMRDRETADADYVARLLAMQRQANPHGKLLLMAFDVHVDEAGVERPELSPFFTPNAYVLEIARRHDEFLPAASIHPYRRDAVERLDAAIDGGARAVKPRNSATRCGFGARSTRACVSSWPTAPAWARSTTSMRNPAPRCRRSICSCGCSPSRAGKGGCSETSRL